MERRKANMKKMTGIVMMLCLCIGMLIPISAKAAETENVRRRITIGRNSKLNSRLTPIRPRGLACNCTFLPE